MKSLVNLVQSLWALPNQAQPVSVLWHFKGGQQPSQFSFDQLLCYLVGTLTALEKGKSILMTCRNVVQYFKGPKDAKG